jgi:hypothetical protein
MMRSLSRRTPNPATPPQKTFAPSSFAFCLSCLLASSGCAFEVIHGNGNVRSEERAVPAFTSTHVAAPLRTDVAAGDDAKVTLQADENLLGHLVVAVKNGALTIDVDDPGTVLEPTATMTATIAAPAQEQVESSSSERMHVAAIAGARLALVSSGSGGMTASDLAVTTVDVDANGSGDVTLTGDVDTLLLQHDGSGAIKAGGLSAQDGHVDQGGSGLVTISVSGQVDGSLTGSGDLVIHGGPSRVDVDDHGSGAVSIR